MATLTHQHHSSWGLGRTAALVVVVGAAAIAVTYHDTVAALAKAVWVTVFG